MAGEKIHKKGINMSGLLLKLNNVVLILIGETKLIAERELYD